MRIKEDILKSSGETGYLQRISQLTRIWLSVSPLEARRHWNIALRILNQIIFTLKFHAQSNYYASMRADNFKHASSQKCYSFSGSNWSRYLMKFKSTQRKGDIGAKKRDIIQETNEGNFQRTKQPSLEQEAGGLKNRCLQLKNK